METIASVEEILNEKIVWNVFSQKFPETSEIIENTMIEFAKLHCKRQAKIIVQSHYLMIDGISEKSNGQRFIVDEGNHYTETEVEVDKDSILNAYDLDNIK